MSITGPSATVDEVAELRRSFENFEKCHDKATAAAMNWYERSMPLLTNYRAENAKLRSALNEAVMGFQRANAFAVNKHMDEVILICGVERARAAKALGELKQP